MAGNKTGIVFTKDEITPRLKALPPIVNQRVGLYMEAQATKVQDYARKNAPWTDQTANARGGLFAEYSGSGTYHEIRLYHTVPYGIWLEVRWAGKYAIIAPTIKAERARIMEGLTKLLDKMDPGTTLAASSLL